MKLLSIFKALLKPLTARGVRDYFDDDKFDHTCALGAGITDAQAHKVAREWGEKIIKQLKL